jgi:hypothetical protein
VAINPGTSSSTSPTRDLGCSSISLPVTTPCEAVSGAKETGRMAAERGHVVGTLPSLSAAGPMFDAYRRRAQELGWTAGPDRFAYAGVVGVGMTREEGLRRANLAADYVRTSVVVADAKRQFCFEYGRQAWDLGQTAISAGAAGRASSRT